MNTFSQRVKRAGNSIRNIFVDPLPRNRTLSLVSIDCHKCGIDIFYLALKRSFKIQVKLPEHLAERIPDIPTAPREQVLTALGIVFAPFLFKLSDFACLDVQTVALDRNTKEFFEKFLVGGLGEFRHRQGLTPTRAIKINAKEITGKRELTSIETKDRMLLLNGGGKDTIVAAELLKGGGQPFTWVTIRPNETRRRVIELSGVNESIEVGYRLDPDIDRYRAYPWGHFPHTSLVMVLGLFVAMLTGSRYVAAGNEFSANYGNLHYRGVEVNHQYTKSYAFERGFSSFVRRAVTESISVFSVLRPFYDLQLARLFANNSHYFRHFISCNRGIARASWCKDCPKCAFTALALIPFVTADDLHQIFGEDPLNSPSLRRHILDLVVGQHKPWECVGTREESRLALKLLLDGNPTRDFPESPRRQDLEVAVADVDSAMLGRTILDLAQSEHSIPTAVVERLNYGLQSVGAKTLQIPKVDNSHQRPESVTA